MASQALKAMRIIDRLNFKCEFPFLTSVELFNTCVKPILLYGAEVWGTQSKRCLENVLHKFCRTQLGVGSKTHLPTLLGETGMYPIFVTCIVKAVKYWCKLICLDDVHLTTSCYK